MLQARRIIFKCTLLSMVFLAGVIAGLFLWERITLPFNNPWEIAGELVALRYNPANNLIRFIIFISLPVSVLLAAHLLNNRRFNELCFGVGNAVWSADHAAGAGPRASKTLSLSLVAVALLVGFTVATFGSSGGFDAFHEGETLGPAISYENGMIPYKQILFWHGVFQDPLRSVLAFNLFGRSIGAVRAFDSILKIVQLILFAFFLRKICGGDYLRVGLIFIALVMFYHLTSLVRVAYLNTITSRDILTVPFLMAIPFLQGFGNNSNPRAGPTKLFAVNFLFSFLALASFGYSIERGFYLCATYLIVSPAIYFFLFRTHRFQIYYLTSALFGLLAGFLVLAFLLRGGLSEFLKFAFLIVPRYKDLVDGKVYPIHTLTGLIACTLIAANIFWMALKFLQLFHLHHKQAKPAMKAFMEYYLIEFSVLLMSIVAFRSALGRSDMGHIVGYSYLPFVLFAFIGIKHYMHPLLQRRRFRSACSAAVLLVILLFSAVCAYRVYSENLVARELPLMVKDSELIPARYKATVSFLKDNLSPKDEFFTMTSEGCWYYFIDRSCPTRFPVSCFAATSFYQHEVVEDLKRSNVKFILYRNNNWTSTIFGLSTEVRQPIITDYIKRHYTFFITIDDNELWINLTHAGDTTRHSSLYPTPRPSPMRAGVTNRWHSGADNVHQLNP
jgi:hypothetical protein